MKKLTAKTQTIILCGGVGYRLKEETEFKPKPMVEVGGKPILWHIMKIYAHYGFNDFIVALGYKGNLVKDYFTNLKYYDADFTLDTKTHEIKHHNNNISDKFKITFVDTGAESLTGERVRLLKKYIHSENFMITYGDGVANINVADLYRFHKRQNSIGTVTGVLPVLKYGGFDVNKDNLASDFKKKARIRHLINGGYMVFKKSAFDLIKPNTMIEDIFLPLIKERKLSIYKHEGFFHAMDTYQDMKDLNKMWTQNPAWKIWR